MSDNSNSPKVALNTPRQHGKSLFGRSRLISNVIAQREKSLELDGANAENWTTLDADVIKRVDAESKAKKWISDITSQLVRNYQNEWQESRGEKFGVFVDPEKIIDWFDVLAGASSEDGYMTQVGLNPHPFFEGRFKAYNIHFQPRLKDDGSLKVSHARVHLYGVDMLGELDSAERRFAFMDVVDPFDDYGYRSWNNEAFEIASVKDELWWHRVFFQSVMHHVNRDATITKPLEAFLQLAKPNEIPSEEEFLKTVDKIKLVEGLG